jgi:uncharacterized RDD family membrane protein YckC
MQFFKQIKQQTPESVELEFTLAGIGSRAYALAIDYLFLGVAILLVVLVATMLSSQLIALVDSLGGLGNVELWLLALAMLALFIIYVGYFALLEANSQGQTPGKRFAKIRVIRDDGRPVGIFQTSLRALLRPVDEFLFLGFLFIVFFNGQEKRLGDLVAGTLVIQAEQQAEQKGALLLSETAKKAAKALLDVSDLSLLLPDDFATVKQYLERRSQMLSQSRQSLALRLAQEVQAILQIEKLPFDMTPDVFLEGVYLGYQAEQEPFEGR